MHMLMTTTAPTRRVPDYAKDALPPELDFESHSPDREPSLETILAPVIAELDALAERLTLQIGHAELSEVVARIHALRDLCDRLYQTSARKIANEMYLKLDALELQIANVFGAKRNWQLSPKIFRWTALIHGVEFSESAIFDLPPYCDHPVFYCDLDGALVAVVAHEYNFTDSKRRECETFALTTGIAFETPDCASWHSAGTTLILWRVKK